MHPCYEKIRRGSRARAIVEALHDGPGYPEEIAIELGVPMKTVSSQLRNLWSAGLLARTINYGGRNPRYLYSIPEHLDYSLHEPELEHA